MTPREPDRFDEQAWNLDLSGIQRTRVATALRREREDALNEAAQIADEYDNEEGHPSPQARALIRIVAERIRALAPPAAAPAAEEGPWPVTKAIAWSEPVAPAGPGIEDEGEAHMATIKKLYVVGRLLVEARDELKASDRHEHRGLVARIDAALADGGETFHKENTHGSKDET